MPLKPWKKLSEAIVFRNPYWTYKRDAFELPSGKPGEYHYVHTNGSSMVVPILGDGTLLLVNQHRYLLGRESAEFPCGSVKDGATYEETARQELREEAGYSAESLLLAGEFNPYNGVTDEMCRVYVARDLAFVGGTPDETEEFELLRLAPAEVEARIRSGAIWDGMTIAAWSICNDILAHIPKRRTDMKTGPMILGMLAAVALFAAAAYAQEPSHAKHVIKYEGTASCVSAACHEGAAKEVAESLHYQQMGIPRFLEGWEPGKPAGMLHSY